MRRLAPAPRRRLCGVVALPAPPGLAPMVRVPAVTTFWTLPRMTLVRAPACWLPRTERAMEPVAPALRLTKLSVDMLTTLEETALVVSVVASPKLIVRALPSPRVSVPAPANVTSVRQLPVAAL